MRLKVIKETFANEEFHFYIKQKGFIFWSKVERFDRDWDGETAYFDTFEQAMEKVASLIEIDMATTVVDVEVVYDTGVKK